MHHVDTAAQGTGALAIAAIFLLALLFTAPHHAWADDAADAATAGASDSTSLTSGTTDATTDQGGSQSSAAVTSAPSIMYRAKMTKATTWRSWQKNAGTAGSTKGERRIGSLQIKALNTPKGSVQYQVHLKKTGWMPMRANGSATATASTGSTIDAVRVKLTGKLSRQYTVSYRVNTQAGWQAWKKNGASAGSVNRGTGIRAVQVRLVKRAAALKTGDTGIVGVRYRALSQKVGWSSWAANNGLAGTTGKALRMTRFRIAVDTGVYQGGVKYRARLNGGRWTAWKRNGQTLANNKIEAVQVKLTGALAKKYDVLYSAHVANIGWQRYLRNGETAGTSQGLQLEALRIKLVPKSEAAGWVSKNGNWYFYQAGKPLVGTWVTSIEQPIEATVGDLQRYWLDAKGVLAVNRYINPKKAVDRKAGWTAYATPSGYVARGKYTNSDGLLLADNEGSLYTKTRWLTTSAFDGEEQKYRLVKKGVATVVKTGLFSVDGKQYYGWEDGRGYIMRSSIQWLGTCWYKASASGVLTSYRGKRTKLVDKYVNWAIAIAKDDSHGYSQANRWGPDYDCSSLVCSSLLAAGFPDSGASWTGNMKERLTQIGFEWHEGTAGLQRGDIMLVHTKWRQHTEIFIGNNQLVGAHIAETGRVTGKKGDQTGNEISVTRYYNAPWQGYLRLKG